MSSNAFNQLDREYNEQQSRIEELRAERRLHDAAPALLESAENALGVLIACASPAGGVDDRKAIFDAQMQLCKAIASATGRPA